MKYAYLKPTPLIICLILILLITVPIQSMASEPMTSESMNTESMDSETTEPCEPACEPACMSSPCPLTYTFLVDQYLSPIVGANALISLEHGYQALDDTFIPSSYDCTDFPMVIGRIGKYLLEGVLFSTMAVAQHEFFGHGFRAREFHLKSLHYAIRPWTGYTAFSFESYNRLSRSEKIALHAAGVEGTYILAKTLRNQWLNTQYMDQREGHLYLKNVWDQTTYILNTNRFRHSHRGDFPYDDSHDIMGYIRNVNLWYGHQVLTSNKLRKMAILDFVDPYAMYSLFSIFKYFYNGCMGFDYPMIPIGDYGYLPGLRLSLAPYGPEYQLINYIRGPNHSVQVTLRGGHTGGKRSSGITFDVYQWFSTDLLNFDGSLYFWHQPRFHTDYAYQAKGRFGAALTFTARYRIINCLELIGQLGYKTSGYIPGEVLRRSPIVRAGLILSP